MTEAKAKADVLAHWRRMLRNPISGPDKPCGCQCAFCQKSGTGCEGCPVFRFTDAVGCYGTPYHFAHRTYYRLRRLSRAINPNDDLLAMQINAWVRWRKAARAVIEFVENLEVPSWQKRR